jgi:arabinose-5-phosphate isomerase
MDDRQSLLLTRGRECILIEADALRATAEGLDSSFEQVVRRLEDVLGAGHKIIFSGIGKSAHIAQKLVGTFNSIGAPACFLDPVNALHGDLGLCAAGDAALLLSNSGGTEELVRLVPLLKRFSVHTIAITAAANSPLASACDDVLAYRVPAEACPLKLAPTASTAAALALGDALAMVLLEQRGFTREDFARLHPAGNLGRILLLRISDVMRSGDRFPCLHDTATTQEAILAMTRAKAGCLALVDAGTGRLTGVFTDGDFRRAALSNPDFPGRPVSDFMTRSPRTIRADALAVEALRIFEEARIDDLLAVDADGRPVGLVDGQDLPKLHLV